MPDYRTYVLDKDEHINTELVVCPDAAVIDRAKQLLDGRSIEVWPCPSTHPDRRAGNVRGGVPCPVPELPASRNLAFDLQHVLIMLTAFESSCAKLRLRKGEEMTDRVALKIVDLANAGERDAARLIALVLLEFKSRPRKPIY
jgi:hypothetical protein